MPEGKLHLKEANLNFMYEALGGEGEFGSWEKFMETVEGLAELMPEYFEVTRWGTVKGLFNTEKGVGIHLSGSEDDS